MLNIEYYNPLYDIEDIFLDDTRNTIAPGAASVIKGGIITMVNSLATDTRDILWITNLLNNSPMYTTDKGGDCQTLRKDENFKSNLKDSVKDNRDRINIYLNINNLHLKPSFKP